MTDPTNPSGRRPIPFDPERLDAAINAAPLSKRMQETPSDPVNGIIHPDPGYPDTRDVAKEKIVKLVERLTQRADAIRQPATDRSPQYVYAKLRAEEILQIANDQMPLAARAGSATGTRPSERIIHRIWLDHKVQA